MKLTKLRTNRVLTWFMVAASGIVLIFSWAVSSAPGGSPDEPTHLISIYCSSQKYEDICKNPSPAKIDLQPVKDISACYLFQRDRSSGCEISSINETLKPGANTTFVIYDENNYYKFLSLFADDRYVESLILMRIVNGITFLIVFLIAIFSLPRDFKSKYVIATFSVLTPLGIYLVTSINTSAWNITGAVGLWASLFSMMYELKEPDKKFYKVIIQIFLFILSSFLIISSRSDGIYFFAIIMVSILIIFPVNLLLKFLMKFMSNKLAKVLIFFGTIVALSIGLYLLRSRAAVTFNDTNYEFNDRLFINVAEIPRLLLGPFGTWGLGWLDVWLSPITYVLMIFSILGLSFFSIKNLKLNYSLGISILLISAIALPLLIHMSSGYQIGEWVQPRYILPIYFPLLGLLIFSSENKKLMSSAQFTMIFLMISIAHSFALFSNLERYIRGQNTYSLNLNVGLEWWWNQLPSPNLIWLLGSISFILLFTQLKKLSTINL